MCGAYRKVLRMIGGNCEMTRMLTHRLGSHRNYVLYTLSDWMQSLTAENLFVRKTFSHVLVAMKCRVLCESVRSHVTWSRSGRDYSATIMLLVLPDAVSCLASGPHHTLWGETVSDTG